MHNNSYKIVILITLLSPLFTAHVTAQAENNKYFLEFKNLISHYKQNPTNTFNLDCIIEALDEPKKITAEQKNILQIYFDELTKQLVALKIETPLLWLVDKTLMPSFHEKIGEFCKKLKIQKPLIVISNDKDEENFHNALVINIAPGIPMMLIGKKLFERLSDQALEALLAHELAHIHMKCYFYTFF